jgi:hypothetical protein
MKVQCQNLTTLLLCLCLFDRPYLLVALDHLHELLFQLLGCSAGLTLESTKNLYEIDCICHYSNILGIKLEFQPAQKKIEFCY